MKKLEPDINEDKIIREFLIAKNSKSEKEILNKSDNIRNIISTYTSDYDEYEINF